LQKASGLGKQKVLEPWQDRGHEPLINSHRMGRVGAVVAIGSLGWSSRPPSRFRPIAFWAPPATPPKLHSVGAGCRQCLRGGTGIEEHGMYLGFDSSEPLILELELLWARMTAEVASQSAYKIQAGKLPTACNLCPRYKQSSRPHQEFSRANDRHDLSSPLSG
jgi:hypothetical protein